ncbi:MAG: flagellar protein FlaG [Gammaproteobacteria bacterium]
MANDITGVSFVGIDAHGKAERIAIQEPGVAAPRQADGASQAEVATGSGAGVERQQLEKAVAEMQDRVASLRTNIEFSIDDKTDKTVIKVIDVEKKEIILQLPPQYLLDLARFFSGDKAAFGRSVAPRSPAAGLLIRAKT